MRLEILAGLLLLAAPACGPSAIEPAGGGGTEGDGDGDGDGDDESDDDTGIDPDADGDDGGQCESDSECGECGYCNAGRCVDEGFCCAQAELEPFGFRCQPPECDGDDDCPQNQTCDGWSCIAECYADSACADDEQCWESICIPRIDLDACAEAPALRADVLSVDPTAKVAAADIDGDGFDALWSFNGDGDASRRSTISSHEFKVPAGVGGVARLRTGAGELVVLGYPAADAAEATRRLVIVRDGEGDTYEYLGSSLDPSPVTTLVALDSTTETGHVALVPAGGDVEIWSVASTTMELVFVLEDTASATAASSVVLADGSTALAVVVDAEVRTYETVGFTQLGSVPAASDPSFAIGVGGTAPSFGQLVTAGALSAGSIDSVAVEAGAGELPPLQLPGVVTHLAAADLSAAERQDVVAASDGGPTVVVQLGDDGTFECATTYRMPSIGALAPGRFDSAEGGQLAAVTTDGSVWIFESP